jgi:Uma2 family endonuclease
MQLLQKSYTPDKYLELEEKAEFRSEYRNGEIVPIAGGTTNHNQIIMISTIESTLMKLKSDGDYLITMM